MLAKRFAECQCAVTVLQSAASLPLHGGPQDPCSPMRLWSLPKVFHTCGKNCGNSSKSLRLLSFMPDFQAIYTGAKAENRVKSGFLTHLSA
jgi:hypothetical protein